MAISITLGTRSITRWRSARAANTTPEEWLDQIVAERLEREDLVETTRVFSEEMRRKMAVLGVKPSDVEREIADYRRGR